MSAEGALNAQGKANTFRLRTSIAMEGEEDVDREGSDNEDNNNGGDDDQAKQEYVKKEFFARPYVSPFTTETDVKALTTKNSRYPLNGN